MNTIQRNEEFREEFFDEFAYRTRDIAEWQEKERMIDWFLSRLANERTALIEEIVKLSDKLEMSQPDIGLEEWKAFKHFRNKLRDSLFHPESGNEENKMTTQPIQSHSLCCHAPVTSNGTCKECKSTCTEVLHSGNPIQSEEELTSRSSFEPKNTRLFSILRSLHSRGDSDSYDPKSAYLEIELMGKQNQRALLTSLIEEIGEDIIPVELPHGSPYISGINEERQRTRNSFTAKLKALDNE